MKVFAPAKVNLTLDITGLREDGYHFMEMVMQTVSLYDLLYMDRIPEGVQFTCDASHLPCDERNLAVRAATAFLSYGKCKGGVSIQLQKRIPSGAGMGGGSADAAAALVAMNRLWETNLSLSELMALGETLGADVPFCLHGGTGLVGGIGERVERLPSLSHCWLVVVKPRASVNTKAAFAAFDRGEITQHPDTKAVLAGLSEGNLPKIAGSLSNVFEQTADFEELAEVKEQLLENHALGAVMTGSGSAIYGLFERKVQAAHCRSLLTRPDRKVYLCEPVPHGPLIQTE